MHFPFPANHIEPSPRTQPMVIAPQKLLSITHKGSIQTEMGVPDLIIDPALKYWVLVPISIALLVFALLRHTIAILTSPSPKLQPLAKFRELEGLKSAQVFKRNYWVLPKHDFINRQSLHVKRLTDGSLLAEDPNNEPQNPLDSNGMDGMMDMAKGQFGNMIAQTAMMSWVNFFFMGFVLMKLPFPLTLRFKQMLQNGVATDDLDVRWVSSISWYFIASMGLVSVMNVLFNDESMGEQLQQQMMLQGGQPPPMMLGAPKQDKVMLAEANDIRIISYESVLDGVEQRVVELYS